MTPKQILITMCVCFSSMLFAQQETTHLSGTVAIDIPKNQIKALYKLTNIQVNSPKMSFLLNEEYKINQVYLNGKPIASSKSGRECIDCKVHNIWIDRPITPEDTVSMDIEGSFKYLAKNGDINPNGGKLFKKEGSLIASGSSKWYPVIMDSDSKLPQYKQEHAYTYDLNVSCISCEAVAVNSDTPQKGKPLFSSSVPTNDLSLMVENLEKTILDKPEDAMDDTASGN